MRRRRGIMGLNGGAGNPVITATATGNPLSFVTDLVRPLKSLEIPFTPIQSGSGDPSPDNVRPISGWTGCNIEHRGKNLFNVNREYGVLDPSTPGQDSPRTFDFSKYYCGFRCLGTYYPDDGNIITIEDGTVTFLKAASVYGVGFPLKLKAGITYRSSFVVNGGMSSATITFYDSHGIYTGWAYAGTGTPLTGRTFTVPEGTETCVLGFQVHNAGTTFSNIMIEPDSGTPTVYEPYQGETTQISWQTEAGTIYGGTVTLNEDGSADLVANYASREYDGSSDESWSLYTAQNGFQIPISSGWQNYAKGWCNALNTVRSASAYAENTCVFGLATSSFYAIRVSALLTEYTVAAWRTYLANNPLQVVFKLKTPITYHFDNVGQLITFVGTNTIWTDTNDTNTATYLKHQS